MWSHMTPWERLPVHLSHLKELTVQGQTPNSISGPCGDLFIVEGTSAGLKSTWTSPPSHWRTELPDHWDTLLAEGKTNTALNEGKPEPKRELHPNKKRDWQQILTFFLKKENTGHYVETKINKESIKPEKLCYALKLPLRATQTPTQRRTRWLLISFDDPNAIWWFNMDVFTVSRKYVWTPPGSTMFALHYLGAKMSSCRGSKWIKR